MTPGGENELWSDVLVLENGPPRWPFRTSGGPRATVGKAPDGELYWFSSSFPSKPQKLNFCLFLHPLANG